MHTQNQLARLRATDLRAKAAAHRLAVEAKPPVDLRTRLGWTLVEVGLRLASPPRQTPAPA
ncbi:hypothetical protein BIV25_32000 [Streptomyces sp. MUSC 14]|uniref:hypothetical protein n=1 Tax=Streptomyces sp. MUSC 14 TaxID=1354889 RepID=UPI0008F55BBB|nr:hypothetical protein [Streptomyces sp. MUSC 14]OIJ90345.1 hypothetical protein BIV25_32000 [Streptomyces sp. MUSC 14]